MKFLAFLCFLISFALHSLGQNEFVPGYIVNIQGDTLRGYLQEEVKKDLIQSVKFKKDDKSSTIQRFGLTDSVSFGYNGGNIYRVVNFLNTSGDSIFSDTCFARQLVKGYFDLYSFLRGDQIFFLVSKGNSSTLLFNSIFTGIGAVKKDGNYISRLAVLGRDCANNHLQANEVNYTEKEISAFVIGVDNCLAPGNTVVNTYHSAKSKMNVEIFAGGFPIGQRSQLTAEARLRIYYPQLGKKSSLNIGVHYSNTVNTSQIFDGYVTHYGKLTHEVFSIPFTIQHDLLTGIIRPYFYGGFSFDYLKESSNSDYFSFAPTGFQLTYGFSLVAGIGIEGRVTKRLHIRADWRYELLIQYPAIGLSYTF